jgi:hypothetical protein
MCGYFSQLHSLCDVPSHRLREFSDALGRALADAGLVVDLAKSGYSEISPMLSNMSRDGIRYACVVEELRHRHEASVVFLQSHSFDSTFPGLWLVYLSCNLYLLLFHFA